MDQSTKLYLQECFTLARTISIKIHESSLAVNKLVSILTSQEVTGGLQTHKYYMNICGLYHTIDQPINIVSLDTRQSILFSHTNWASHPLTRKEYSFGSSRYKDLVQQMPSRETFILSSLYPADMQTATESKNGTILAYDKSLVLENEYTLMSELQQFIYDFFIRWYNPGYAAIHDLYLSNFYLLLHSSIYMKIVSMRTDRIHTDQVHDFHIKNHLASHHALDVYYNDLTVYQRHWLYRNLTYIKKHAGHKDTFKWLVENLFDKRGLPLYEYTLKHSVDKDIDNKNPIPVFKRGALTSVVDLVAKTVSTEQTLKELDPQALYNKEYRTDNTQLIKEELSYSLADTQSTKILECSVDDIFNIDLFPLDEIKLFHWLAYSSTAQYDCSSEINLNKEGITVLMHVKDAAVIYLKALCEIHFEGQTFDDFSKVCADFVYMPKADDIQRINTYIPQSVLSTAEAQTLFSMMPAYKELKTVLEFTDYCDEIRKGYMKQYISYSSINNETKDSAALTAALLRQRRVEIDYSSVDIQQLMKDYFIGFENYTKDDYQNLADNISKAFIYSDSDVNTDLRKIQIAMISIMRKLSSYSITITDNTTDPKISYVEVPTIKTLYLQSGGISGVNNFSVIQDTVVQSHHNTALVEVDLYPGVFTHEKEPRKFKAAVDILQETTMQLSDTKAIKHVEKFDQSHFTEVQDYAVNVMALSPQQRLNIFEQLSA